MDQHERIQYIRELVNHPGWTQVAKPELIERGRQLIHALTSAPEERAGLYKGVSDDGLRQRFQEVQFLANWFDKELEVYDTNRVFEEVRSRQAPAQGSPYGAPSPLVEDGHKEVSRDGVA